MSFTRKTRPSVNPFVATATREVFGEHGLTPRAARSPREREIPTDVGDARSGANTDKTIVNKGRFQITGYPHRGEGCGDTLNRAMQGALSLKKGSSGVVKRHHSTTQRFLGQ